MLADIRKSFLGSISIALLWALGVPSQASATPVELVTNGGFETGTLAGWTTTGLGSSGTCPSANRDWNVSSTNSTGCYNVGNPVDGTYAAYNMFDGTGPLTYRMWQTIALPSVSSATLSWKHSARWNFSGAARMFDIDFFDATGATLLANLYNLTVSGSGNTGGWVSLSQGITGAINTLAGQTVRLTFSSYIPMTWTGPAGLGLDSVSILATPVPEPTTLVTLGLGLVGLGFGRRRSRRARHGAA